MRAAVYARVSTTNHGQDVSMQTRELREYCERRGWKIAGEYLDEGISGSKEKRPELDRLMADAHRRKFDVVAVWKFDRFARSVSHLLRALDTFKTLGVEFVSLSESLDTATPAGRMVFTVLGAVAELERSLIAERVRGVAQRARQGKGPRAAPAKSGCLKGIGPARTGARLEEHCEGVEGWRRNSLSGCSRAFQNSGKGFWNPVAFCSCPDRVIELMGPWAISSRKWPGNSRRR